MTVIYIYKLVSYTEVFIDFIESSMKSHQMSSESLYLGSLRSENIASFCIPSLRITHLIHGLENEI